MFPAGATAKRYITENKTDESQPAITCSKLTIKIPERRHWRRSGIFIVNLEHSCERRH